MSETIADIAAKSRSVDDFIDTICRRVKIRKPSKSSYWAVVVECMYNEIRHLACRNQPGDAAAMREALKNVEESATEVMDRVRYKDGLAFNTANYIAGVAKAALAAPPRNCDRFKTKEEAEIEFMMSDELPRDGGDTKMRAWMCRFIDWLLAPATEQKGDENGSK